MSREPTFRSPVSRAILLIIIEAVILTVVIIGVYLLLPDRTGEARAVRPVITEQPEAEAEPSPPAAVAETPAPAVSEPSEPTASDARDYSARAVVAEHVVRAGDTLWDLSAEIWGSRHLWPDLYRFNRVDIPDPDDLTIGFRLQVPDSLLSDVGTLSSDAVSHLLDSYVIAYRAYRTAEAALAERASRTDRRDLAIRSRLKRSRAQWLLYSAHRFDDTFVISRAADIDPDDIAVVESYLSRFGRPEFSLD